MNVVVVMASVTSRLITSPIYFRPYKYFAMKIGVLADFHLGYSRFNSDAFSQAAKALSSAVDSCDMILLAGDLFDSRTPKPEVLGESFSLFRIPLKKKWGASLSSFKARDGRNESCGLPVAAIHGTHEMRAKSLANPIQLLEAAGFLVNVHAATAVFELGGEKVAVTGIGGVPEKQFKDAVKALDPKPVEGAFNVFMFHQTLREIIPQAPEDYSTADDLPSGFDLYVCGHIHSPLDREYSGKRVLIPGSTVLTQLRSEEQSKKGFFVFDTSSKSASFSEVGSRQFKMLELELDSASPSSAREECVKSVESALQELGGEKPILRVKLKGTLQKGFTSSDLDLRSVERDFEDKAFVFIDSHLKSEDLRLQVEKLRSLKQDSVSVRELGLRLLKQSLAENGFSLESDVDSLFDLLSDKKADNTRILDELISS